MDISAMRIAQHTGRVKWSEGKRMTEPFIKKMVEAAYDEYIIQQLKPVLDVMIKGVTNIEITEEFIKNSIEESLKAAIRKLPYCKQTVVKGLVGCETKEADTITAVRRWAGEEQPKGVSRQRRWQIEKKKEGRCVICGKPSITQYHCDRHRKEASRRSLERYYRKKND